MNNLFTLSVDEIKSLPKDDIAAFGKDSRFYIRLKSRRDGLLHFYEKHIDKSDIEIRKALMKEISRFDKVLYRLDDNNLIPDSYCLEFSRSIPKTLKLHCKWLFPCVYWMSDNEYKSGDYYLKDYFEKAKKDLKEARKLELIRRLLLVAEEYLIQDKWFCVFNTLTVDNENYGVVFSRGGKRWQSYCERMDNLFARAAYGSVRKAKGKDYHKYFAVTEKGGKTGRLHIHVLHFFKSMPDDFKDPNYGLSNPKNREISYLKQLWEDGWSVPIAVRFSQDDAYGCKGWVWPTEFDENGSKTWQPIVSKPPQAVIQYVGKYFDKAEYDKHEDKIIWRAKMSRNLGLNLTIKLLESLPLECQKSILLRKLKVKFEKVRFPRQVVRRYLLKKFGKCVESFGRSTLIIALRECERLKGIVEQLKDLMKIFREFSPGSYGSIEIPIMKRTEDFSIFNSNFGISLGGVCGKIA